MKIYLCHSYPNSKYNLFFYNSAYLIVYINLMYTNFIFLAYPVLNSLSVNLCHHTWLWTQKNMTLSGLLIEFNLPLSKFLSKIMFKGPSEFLVLKFNTEINKNQIIRLYIPGIFFQLLCSWCQECYALGWLWGKEQKSERWHGEMEHSAFGMYFSDESYEGRG